MQQSKPPPTTTDQHRVAAVKLIHTTAIFSTSAILYQTRIPKCRNGEFLGVVVPAAEVHLVRGDALDSLQASRQPMPKPFAAVQIERLVTQ